MGLVQATADLGVSLVAFSPVGRSLLTDRPHSFKTAQAVPFLKPNPRFNEPNLSANIAATVGLSVPQHTVVAPGFNAQELCQAKQ